MELVGLYAACWRRICVASAPPPWSGSGSPANARRAPTARSRR